MFRDLYTLAHQRHINHLRQLPVSVDAEGMRLGSTYVMFFAEAELMRLHAGALLAGRCAADLLEVGLGLGVFAEQAATFDLASYTAIETHPGVAALTEASVLSQLDTPVRLHTEPWQTIEPPHAAFDAIMYDTWPPDGLADADFARFVKHVALPCLRPGGRFSFFYPAAQLSPQRAQVLDSAFPDWGLSRYTLPADRTPRGWTKSTRDFVIPVATKDAP